MSALVHIVRKSVKNSLLELLKKPGKLIMYILLIGLIGGAVAVSVFTEAHMDEPVPMFWFKAVLFLFVALFVVIAFVKGLASGDVIFEMSDVNLLFVSPVNTRSILLYGVIRMAKTAFAASFFILFQTNSLASFGIGFGGVLIVFAGFLLSVFVLTVASLLIYSVTNGREGRKRFVKCLAVLLFLPLAVHVALRCFEVRDVAWVLEAAVASPLFKFVPIAGWTATGVGALLSGELATGLLFLGLNLLLGFAMIAYIMLSNPDYYEDVLVATETVYEKKRAMAEGNLNAAVSGGKAVKVTKTGIGGSGGAALFGKHMRESLRENRFGLLTLSSVVIVAGAVLMTFVIGDLLATLIMLMWIQVFMIGTGRGLRETFSHYIYLIPETSFKKILWSNMEFMLRIVIENALIFGIATPLIHANAGYAVVCAVAFTLFSFMLLGVNYLFMRFTGADISAGLMVMLYFFAVIIALAPGVAIAAAVGFAAGVPLGLLALSGWELAVGLVCFLLSGSILHDCDMAMMKTNK